MASDLSTKNGHIAHMDIFTGKLAGFSKNIYIFFFHIQMRVNKPKKNYINRFRRRLYSLESHMRVARP